MRISAAYHAIISLHLLAFTRSNLTFPLPIRVSTSGFGKNVNTIPSRAWTASSPAAIPRGNYMGIDIGTNQAYNFHRSETEVAGEVGEERGLGTTLHPGENEKKDTREEQSANTSDERSDVHFLGPSILLI